MKNVVNNNHGAYNHGPSTIRLQIQIFADSGEEEGQTSGEALGSGPVHRGQGSDRRSKAQFAVDSFSVGSIGRDPHFS